MTSYSLIPLVVLIGYLLPLTIVLGDRRAGARNLLFVYIIASAAWAFTSFMVYANYFPGQLSLWGRLLPVAGLWAIVAYCHLVCTFTGRHVVTWTVLGYAFIASLAVLAALGYIPQSLQYAGGTEADIYYGQWLYLLIIGGAWFTGLPIFYLVQRYRASKDPQIRNRVTYLLIGVSLLAFFSARMAFPPFTKYPLEHLGHLSNALLISYAISGYKPLDVKLVMRKGLAYLSLVVFIASSYMLMLTGLQYFIQSWGSTTSLAAIIGMAFFMVVLFNPLLKLVQRTIDKFFYGEAYDYRRKLPSLGQRMSSVLDLGKLAEGMLKPIPKAMNATQASLLLPDNGEYTMQFGKRIIEGQQAMPINLSKDGPVVSWLATKDKPLSRELIDVAPEFKGLSEVESNSIEGAEIELLLPMKSDGKLVGILALSKKRSGGLYSSDDVDMLINLADEAAVAVENAQLYAQAKDRAHIDELTGLLNHGYFHDRVDEEIARCSRFGDIFSVLFLDLDLFKAYNDVHGHLAGDDILKEIAQYIVDSIRGIDIAFRYGGDEFTVILPQAPLDDAYNIAERIRKRIESRMDSRGIALTCSMGIASWPTDGVMREEILQAADAALYHSKQAGRNRISLAYEIKPSQVPGVGVNGAGEQEVLSTIHALAATVDAKDPYTYGHSKKTCQYATEIAEALGYSEEQIATIRAAALLHDIGKIRVSDRLLAKRGPLRDDDWDPIYAHPKLGVAILKHVKSLNGCLAAIQYHHERWDGGGYPAGLEGENIPLDARILAVADAYDAMTSSRPYREGRLTHEQAMDELKRNAGTQFDPEIVNVFVSLWEPLDAKKARRGLSRLTRKDQRDRLNHVGSVNVEGLVDAESPLVP
jgi:diguanylate cyclase (GGDEF)-like protein/putative nucleotidyltransferase with HDIG domain